MRFRCQIGEGPPQMLTPSQAPPQAMPRPVTPLRAAAALPRQRPPRRGPALGVVVSAVLLGASGCATPEPKTPTKAWTIEPLLGVTHTMQSSEAYYTLGRYHDGAQE